MLDNLVSSENPLLGLQVAILSASSHGSKSVSEPSGVFLIITLILANQGPILMALFTPIKTPSPNIVTLQVGTSTYELGWG